MYTEEEQNDISVQPFKKRKAGRIVISTTVAPELHRRAQDYNIQWSEALRRGITAILAEKDDPLYQNPRQMAQKMAVIMQRLEETSQKMHSYKEQLDAARGENGTNTQR